MSDIRQTCPKCALKHMSIAHAYLDDVCWDSIGEAPPDFARGIMIARGLLLLQEALAGYPMREVLAEGWVCRAEAFPVAQSLGTKLRAARITPSLKQRMRKLRRLGTMILGKGDWWKMAQAAAHLGEAYAEGDMCASDASSSTALLGIHQMLRMAKDPRETLRAVIYAYARLYELG